eukprot:scaffold118639_cov20-Cyclotella_meneghiniana.AAC.1
MEESEGLIYNSIADCCEFQACCCRCYSIRTPSIASVYYFCPRAILFSLILRWQEKGEVVGASWCKLQVFCDISRGSWAGFASREKIIRLIDYSWQSFAVLRRLTTND